MPCYTSPVKAFLLGAGASIDAGLPGSMGLTRVIVDRLEDGRLRSLSRVLHVVIGAMVQHDTSRGGSAFDGVDVERVFAAVKALKDRDSIDLSAFVERWSGALDSLSTSGQFPPFWEGDIRDGILSSRMGGMKLKRAFSEGVRAVTGSRDSQLIEQVERRMLEALTAVLRVDDARTGYLTPMVCAKPMAGIATLNYDLAVESACRQNDLTVDTGMDAWTGGYSWRWREGVDVRLLKLHGSLDYVLGSSFVDGARMESDSLARVELDERAEFRMSPAMVFGQGSKLRSDGPFLAMLVEFDRMLDQSEWLTIVGYSFRDDHINAALRRWINGDRAKRLSVIDPQVQSWQDNPRESPFFRELVRAVSGHESEGQWDKSWTGLEHDFIALGAAEGLASLHGA